VARCIAGGKRGRRSARHRCAARADRPRQLSGRRPGDGRSRVGGAAVASGASLGIVWMVNGPRRRSRSGNFLAVPLPSGGFGYARVLPKLMAFYAIRTAKCFLSVDDLETQPIAFIAAVEHAARKIDQWPIIGYRALPLELLQDVHFFRP